MKHCRFHLVTLQFLVFSETSFTILLWYFKVATRTYFVFVLQKKLSFSICLISYCLPEMPLGACGTHIRMWKWYENTKTAFVRPVPCTEGLENGELINWKELDLHQPIFLEFESRKAHLDMKVTFKHSLVFVRWFSRHFTIFWYFRLIMKVIMAQYLRVHTFDLAAAFFRSQLGCLEWCDLEWVSFFLHVR